MPPPALRNLSIVAHVDHGKTTLVDALLRQSGQLRTADAETDRVMDSMDLERERGLTIMAKNTAIQYGDVKINIVDTPGHADFGGEVERSLALVDGVLLLVDAAEGPLPQTRFVLEKALSAGLPVLVAVNKIDRQDARPAEVLDEVYDLFIDLEAAESQLDFPVLYTVGRDGIATTDLAVPGTDLVPLLDAILEHVPPPFIEPGVTTQFLAAMLDYDEFVGRLALGRVRAGALVRGERFVLCGAEGPPTHVKLTQLYTFEGLRRVPAERVEAGEIAAVAGLDAITIGDTIADAEQPMPAPRIHVEEPTVSIEVSINDSPLAGRSGRWLTSRQIKGRLEKESLHNVAVRIEATDSADTFKVNGRGELQLGVLIEMMRREGFEVTISRPRVVEKTDEKGRMTEPFEHLTIDVPETRIGTVTEMMARRQGRLGEMINRGPGRIRMVYRVPSRGLIGFRGEFLTQTRGEGIAHSLYDGHDRLDGVVARRTNGALVADRAGKATSYAINALQPRGVLFVSPGEEVYEGMIVGEHNRSNDLNVNIVRSRQLTNFRAAAADEALVLDTPRQFTLETAIEWIDHDELVEVTPDALRLRKRERAGNRRTVKRGD